MIRRGTIEAHDLLINPKTAGRVTHIALHALQDYTPAPPEPAPNDPS